MAVSAPARTTNHRDAETEKLHASHAAFGGNALTSVRALGTSVTLWPCG